MAGAPDLGALFLFFLIRPRGRGLQTDTKKNRPSQGGTAVGGGLQGGFGSGIEAEVPRDPAHFLAVPELADGEAVAGGKSAGRVVDGEAGIGVGPLGEGD